MTRNISEDRILQRIVDMYVFQNLDYFILLDAKRNTYTMFSDNKNDMPIPAPQCDDYTAEMIRYNQLYVAPEDLTRVTANMQIPHVLAMLEKQDQYSFSSSGITDSGKFRRTRVQYQYYDKSMGLILLTRTDITQIFLEDQARHNQLTAAMRDAQHDALTDLYNHKATKNLISSILDSRYWNKAAFLFIDVDNFKTINDTLGHQAGDKLLQFLASNLKELAGHDGIAGRVGGDEFLLFLPTESDLEAIEHCAKKICKIFTVLSDRALEKLPISCSVGIAIYPKDGTSYEALVKKADQALYSAKHKGKNTCSFYTQHDIALK